MTVKPQEPLRLAKADGGCPQTVSGPRISFVWLTRHFKNLDLLVTLSLGLLVLFGFPRVIFILSWFINFSL